MADYISQITLPDNSTYDLKDSAALPKSGGQMTGPLTWKNSTALPETTSGQYFLVIDAFSNGGTTKWIGKANALTSLGAAASSHNHNGVYVPNTSGANDANTLVNTGIYNITSGSLTNGPKDYGYGQLLVMSYRKHTGNTTTDWASQLYLHNGGGTASGNASAPGNVLYYRTSNSASSNTWFDWQKAVHVDAAYTKIGDTNKPVYIAEDGTATEISYTIEKSVPSNAVFTDHYAWGDITGKPTKITLTGAVTGNVSLGAGELSLSTTVNHNHDTDYVKKINSDDNAIARFDGTAGQIQNSGVLIDDNNNVTTTGHFILEKASNVTWATSGQNTEPAFEMKGATKTFKFKFSAAGENVDVGWDWTAGDGSGAFFRSTKASSNAGMFGFFARKTLSNGTKTSSELWGYASDTNNGGKLIWASRRVVTATDNTQIGSATQPVYISNTGIATACTALKALAYKDSLTSSDIPNNAANTTGNAATATTATYIKCTDTRSAALEPTDLNAAQGVRFDFKAKGTIGLTATDNYAGVMSFRPYASASDWSGGNAHQLAFNSEGLHWRNGSTSWGNWYQILDSNNTAAGSNNADTLTWSTTYTIAKINDTDIKFTTMAKPSYNYSDISSRPTSIKLTGAVTGTVTLGNGENSIATSVNHNHDDRYKIASGVITLGSSTITPVTSVNGHSGASVNVTASDLGLASALKYVGTKSSLPTATDSTTYSTYNNGDVITVSNKEYAYVKGSNAAGSSWVELGDEGSYKLKQTAFTNSTGTADGSNTSTTFIYSFSQNANGTITDIKTRKLPTYNNYSHPTGDGNLHVPATGTSNNGKFLKAGSTAGSISWASLEVADISDIANNYLKLNGSNNMTADINIIVGDTDKFVNFWYNTNKKAGASWRIGMLGSGSSDTNYFSIESGTSTTTATTWTSALRIGQNTYDIGIKGNLYPYDTATSLGTNSKKWGDVYATTFKSGAWNGTQIGVAYGGTGTTTSPSQGGIIYGSSSTAYASTAAGIAGQVLKSHGTDAPEWENEYSIEIIQL